MISLDANRDGHVRDAFYANKTVSSNGTAGPLAENGGFFEVNGTVMVWSRGPDRKANASLPANIGVNKDNILSWR
jgi:hypothetical protein